jgi:hypothetical protein
MPLSQRVVEFFNNPASSKTVATVDAQGNVYAAPFGSVRATPDGSQLIFTYLAATETPKRIDYMKKAGKMPVIVVQYTDQEKGSFEGYCVWCKIGDIVTSGPLVEKVKAQLPKPIIDAFPPKAVVTLRPVKYKIQGAVPDMGKTVTL